MQRLLVGLLGLASVVCAQHRVDPRNTYVRVVCVVPIIGKGTVDDPKRPQYAPLRPTAKPTAAPLKFNAPAQPGIIAWSQQASDDGKYALVEFVAADRSALKAILNDKEIKAFEKGKDKKDDIEKELKKYRKDFDLDKFGLVLP